MTAAQNPTPVLRDAGELLGFLQPFDDAWTPCTVFGIPIASPRSRAAAEAVLRAHGLSYLADRWEVFQDGAWITVTLVEAKPGEVTVQYADYGHPELFNTRLTLTAPTPEQLRRQ
ncbi:hypothetical protein G7067_10575 [Leucobacter insecticola]|uniref:Uncharacterized protein n=1 Tax=Leucobacter insecticola TaxID=2714934 RepID=A0A6G8FKD9_9MICO|nr:hypothetical protein [Leucobacter insecticola]QIM16749.1 hypothetical protein G7067_10575 [Leucobacter insecticola]